MRKAIFTIIALAVLSNFAFGQWQFVDDWVKAPQPHGIVTDNDGKIWIGYFGPSDSLQKADGTFMKINALRCYDSKNNFEQAPFSPVMIFTNNADIKDTLDYAKPLSCRGLAKDHEGNILYVGSRGQMYRINAMTGEAMNKLITPVAASLTHPSVTSDGYIFLGHVGSNNPCYIFDSDFGLTSYVADTVKGLQRAILVTPDGKDVYMGKIYSGNNGITHYHSEDGIDGEYVLMDTLWANPDKVLWAQCLDWDPWGLMWVGTYWDVRPQDFQGWYQLNPKENFAMVDSIGMNNGKDNWNAGVRIPPGGTYYSPRGISFLEGDGTWWAFTNDFDAGLVKRWQNPNPYTGLFVVEDGVVVRNFVLKQNYPNPFNPTTTIPFQMEKNGFVELKVYNVNGSLVKTLVSEKMTAGSYAIPFNASDLSTGTYYYRLTIDGKVATKAMTLIK